MHGGADPVSDCGGVVLLFDGVCKFCDGAVQFFLARDRERRVKFAAIQSQAGQAILRRFGLPTNRLDSMVLVQNDRCYVKSTAAIRVAKNLSGLWPALYIFMIIPKPIRDFFYDQFARRRYRWFGKFERCKIPSPQIRERFLD